MTPSAIQANVWRGFAIAAEKLGGTAMDWYRPPALTGGVAGPVIAPANHRGQLPASLAVDARYSVFQPPGKPLWRALVDGAQVQIGDYLVGTGPAGAPGTFFIGEMAPLLTIMAVRCNATLSVWRGAGNVAPPPTPQVGAVGRWEPTAATDLALMTGWPASLLTGGHGEEPPYKLATDTRAGGFTALLPVAFDGGGVAVPIRFGDRVTDGVGAYTVSVAERTDIWRLILTQAEV